ncbi:MAG: HAMP domain-containing histidine kinase, partial [Synergistaceae bacterium]|nr:HAMP domain-containing histidine kinase [Synergistaceae bacterium]
MFTQTKIFSATVLMFIVISMGGSRIDSRQIIQTSLMLTATRDPLYAGGTNGTPWPPMRGGLAPAILLCSLGLAVAASGMRKSRKPFMKTREKHPGRTMPVDPCSYPSNARWAFLASVGHEMKPPIDAIINLSEMSLDSGRIQNDDYKSLEKIYNSAVILSNLMNDIMETARIGCESCGTVSDEYDTPKLINDTILLNMMHISGKQVKFNLYIDASFPLRLKGDILKVKHIFSNILSNAFKFTPAGSVNWELYSERDKKDDKAVWIVSKVSDTGVGIGDENIGRILSGCGKINYPKTDRPTGGTGLGLSITKHMAEMMRGSVSVESRRGGGSVFTTRFRQTLAGSETIGVERVRDLSNFN